MKPRRVRLGAWACRSGNSVDAFLDRAADGYALALEWDAPPPLAWHDEFDYITRIRPAIVARAQEYLEQLGVAVMLSL